MESVNLKKLIEERDALKLRLKEINAILKVRRDKDNIYNNKQYCKYCDQYIFKYAMKTHLSSQKHIRNSSKSDSEENSGSESE